MVHDVVFWYYSQPLVAKTDCTLHGLAFACVQGPVVAAGLSRFHLASEFALTISGEVELETTVVSQA